MKQFFLFALLSSCISCSVGQTSCHIKKAYAYYTVSVPGAQMTDENGNPIPPKPDITRFIYVECSGIKMPEIKTVLYNNIPLSFSVVRVKERTVSIGNKFENSRLHTISAKKGNTLWKINLQPMAGKNMPEPDCKNIIIKSRMINRSCRFYLQKEIQFLTPPRY